MTTRIPIRLKAPGSKMRNVRVQVDGIWFQSRKEANRWCELQLLERSGEISCLERQSNFPLAVHGQIICHYRADFCYHNVEGDLIVEDAKGRRDGPAYEMFSFKKKLMKACLGIEIQEI